MSKMMRISDATAKHLNELARQTSTAKQALLEQAIELFAREMFLKRANEEYEQLTPEEKKKYTLETSEWDVCLQDGLKHE